MTSLLRLLTFNASIQPERYPPTLDPDVYDPIIRREIITSFLVAAGVDLDLICLQGFVPGDFKGVLRLLPSFHGLISSRSGCALLARRTSFDSIHFEDRDGVVRVRAVPTGTDHPIQIWSVDLTEETMRKFEPGPQIVSGTFPSKLLEAQGLIDALRKVGNFEPTRPFDQAPAIGDHLFVQDLKPVSGDVDDRISSRGSNGHLWSIQSEARRIEAVLNSYGSDHLPIRALVRVGANSSE
jgi:hypothetical protein